MTGSTAQLPFPTASVTHAFREPTDIFAATGNEPVLLELISTNAFQRLKGIRFLGAIDYCRIPRPNGKLGATRFSRYEHSLGVMQLAVQYCSTREVSPSQRRLICTAALLHDIGHPPLSHSIEPLFKEAIELDHHKASEEIICGRVFLGEEVLFILKHHGVDIEMLLALISGKLKDFDGFFDGPINFDTIEGILRCHNYQRSTPAAGNPTAVTKAAIRRRQESDRDVIDEFWKLKDLVYKNLINSSEGILSDFACKLYLRRSIGLIDEELYYSTEKRLFSIFPRLRELLTSGEYQSFVACSNTAPLYYTDRNYFVDPRGNFFMWEDELRYKQTRCKRVLEIQEEPELAKVKTVAVVKGGIA